MRVAIEKNGKIINVIEAESVAAAQALFPDATALDADATGAQKGYEDQGNGTYAPPAAPAPEPVPLTKLQFVSLGQTAGGMTDAQLGAARNDTQLAAMWIKLDLATVVDKDNTDTQAAIAALDALGYLPNGAQAVLDAWPVG